MKPRLAREEWTEHDERKREKTMRDWSKTKERNKKKEIALLVPINVSILCLDHLMLQIFN